MDKVPEWRCHHCGEVVPIAGSVWLYLNLGVGHIRGYCERCVGPPPPAGELAIADRKKRRGDGAWEALAERYGRAPSTAKRSEP